MSAVKPWPPIAEQTTVTPNSAPYGRLEPYKAEPPGPPIPAWAGGEQIDRELEQFRKDNAVRVDDRALVSDRELEAAHDQIRERCMVRYGNVRNAFRSMDTDGSGKCSQQEFQRMLMLLNLSNIPPRVMSKLAQICDVDGDGVDYREYARLIFAEDALPLLAARRKAEAK